MEGVKGSIRALVFYDVAEQIQLDKLRENIGAKPPTRAPSFKHPAPEYVRFEHPPVIQALGPTRIAGEQFETLVKYFDYGVVCVELELAFETDWQDLVLSSSRWTSSPEIETRTSELIRTCLAAAKPSLVQPYPSWLSEDYYVIHVTRALDESGNPATGQAMLTKRGQEIAKIVRGESMPLSDAECHEALQSSISYYPTDLLVVAWAAAFVYDTPEGAAATIQLLEYANTQLLEFRHYDELLTPVLQHVYKMLDQKRGGLTGRWRMARQAEKLNAMRLDVIELTERSDNAIKFLSDMFYARAYRIASNKVGVADYRNLVEQKLRVAGELYDFLVNAFHQARAFVLELMVVAILVIELVHLFRTGR